MNEKRVAENRETLRALRAGEVRYYAGDADYMQESIDLFERMIASLEESIDWIRKRIEQQ